MLSFYFFLSEINSVCLLPRVFVCLWSSFFSPANKNLDSPFNFKLCQWVRSLGWEDSLEEGMATHCSTLTWRIQRTEKPSIGSQRVRQDWSHLACIHTLSLEMKLLNLLSEQYTVLFHWVEGGWKENCNMMLLEHFSLPLLHILNAF